MSEPLELRLSGPRGEPVDFARTIVSHGAAELPPNRVDLSGRALETTLPVPRGARTVRITEHDEKLRIEGSADPKLTKAHTNMGWSGWPSHNRDLQALLQVHILGLELVKLR